MKGGQYDMSKIKSKQSSQISLSKTQLKPKTVRTIHSRGRPLFYTNLEINENKRNGIVSSAAQVVPFTDKREK